MLKQSAMLELKINDRIYQLHLPSECPLGEVHDALYQMRTYVLSRIQEAMEADKPKESPVIEEIEQKVG